LGRWESQDHTHHLTFLTTRSRAALSADLWKRRKKSRP
jgi:hypothetical protein